MIGTSLIEIRIAVAAVLAAGLFLFAALQAGQAYRSASDIELRVVSAGGPVRSAESGPQPRPSPTGSPSTSGDVSAPAASPRPPAAAPTPVQRKRTNTPAPAPPVVHVERSVNYNSTDDYEDDYEDEDDADRKGDEKDEDK